MQFQEINIMPFFIEKNAILGLTRYGFLGFLNYKKGGNGLTKPEKS
jgi:hypothetical protein